MAAAWRASSSSSGGISGGAMAGSAFGLVPAATLHLQADAVREVVLRPRRDVRGVFLERVRCGEHDRLRAGRPEPRYELPVRRDHGRAGLAGPDDRQHTYRSHCRRDLLAAS
jgi:hypothetical protein